MFYCNQCGECCRHLDNSVLYQTLNRGDGICKYLDGNLCTIYNNRPLLCRVDESYFAYYKEIYSLEEYYEMNYQSCLNLQSNQEEK